MTKIIPREAMGCVSTGNITEQDGNLLANPAAKLPGLLYRNDGSAMFYVELDQKEIAEKTKEMSAAGLSKEFQNIYLLAHREQLAYLRFDRDGELLDGHPVFNW